jgi:hypothetical protein
MIGFWFGGARICRKAYAHWAVMIYFYRNVQASGVIPQISPLWVPLVERYIRPRWLISWWLYQLYVCYRT